MLSDPTINPNFLSDYFGSYKKIEIGLFEINHHNFHLLINESDWEDNFVFNEMKKVYNQTNYLKEANKVRWYSFNEYGVCDSPEQFMEKYGKELKELPEEFCVAFTRVDRCDQEERGGWRWHKWGEYVGNGEITTEYLYDEPNFNYVYCFSVYRKKNNENKVS
jgi:hypothetical protein